MVRSLLLALLLVLSPMGLVACADPTTSANVGCGTSGVPCLQGKALVELKTSKGVV